MYCANASAGTTIDQTTVLPQSRFPPEIRHLPPCRMRSRVSMVEARPFPLRRAISLDPSWCCTTIPRSAAARGRTYCRGAGALAALHLGLLPPDRNSSWAAKTAARSTTSVPVVDAPACQQPVAWHAAGIHGPDDGGQRVGGGVCPPRFCGPPAPGADETGIEPSQLELEITETALMWPCLSWWPRWKSPACGRSLSPDDLAPATPAWATSLPAAALLRKSTNPSSRSVPGDGKTRVIVLATCRWPMRWLDVVAEGVGAGTQRDFLADQGCDLIQGWLVAWRGDARSLKTGCAHRAAWPLIGWRPALFSDRQRFLRPGWVVLLLCARTRLCRPFAWLGGVSPFKGEPSSARCVSRDCRTVTPRPRDPVRLHRNTGKGKMGQRAKTYCLPKAKEPCIFVSDPSAAQTVPGWRGGWGGGGRFGERRGGEAPPPSTPRVSTAHGSPPDKSQATATKSRHTTTAESGLQGHQNRKHHIRQLDTSAAKTPWSK